jgi:Sec7-like guanine-nucleotide exchange factor
MRFRKLQKKRIDDSKKKKEKNVPSIDMDRNSKGLVIAESVFHFHKPRSRTFAQSRCFLSLCNP